MNPARTGTKAAAHYVLDVPAGGTPPSFACASPRPGRPTPFGPAFDASFAARLADADEFYERITPRSLTEDERRVHRQAIAGMLWGKQFYFYDVDRWLKEHEAHPLLGAKARERAELRLVPHVQRRRHLDARQVGVPLVRRLGPRVPHGRPRARRLRLRQGAAPPDAPQPLLPPERPDPGLRVELRRREPARPRLGDALPLQVREEPRPGGPHVPRARLPGAAAELQLVGEPEGPVGEERLRGRLPRPRQHRRLRPEREAPDRGHPRAGRRDGLDGLLLPEHARHRDDPGRGRPGLRGGRLQVPPALRLDRLRDGPDRRAPRRDVGRGGRLLLRRPAAPERRRDAPEGPLDGRPPPALRRHGLRGGDPGADAEAEGADRALPQAPPGRLRAHRPDRGGLRRVRRTAGSSPSSTGRSSSASSATSSTRTSSSAPTGSGRSRSSTRSTRSSSTSRGRPTSSRTSRPSRTTGCSAGTRTGAGRSGCR